MPDEKTPDENYSATFAHGDAFNQPRPEPAWMTAVAPLDDRVRLLERLIYGEPDEHAEDKSYPKPPPPEPGLVAKVESIWRYLGRSDVGRQSLRSVIEEVVRERAIHEEWRLRNEREARTLRGRIRGVLQYLVDRTYRPLWSRKSTLEHEVDAARQEDIHLGIFGG